MESRLPLITHNESFRNEEESSICNGCSFAQTTFNMVNLMVGVGLLSTPYTIQQAGWMALIVLGLFVVVCCYTGILVKKCIELKGGALSYPDIGQAAFGSYGRVLISLYSVELINLETGTLELLFPGTSIQLGSLRLNSKHIMGILSGVIVLPTMFLKDLKILSNLSAMGVVLTAIIPLCLIVLCATEGIGYKEAPLVKWSGIPFAVGVFGFCTSVHAMFPTLYQSMADKRQYSKAVITCFVTCYCLLGGVAIIGYFMYGQNTSEQITWNMPQDNFVSKVAVFSTICSPFTKYALTMKPVSQCVEQLILCTEGEKTWRHVLMKVLLVVSTVLVALFVPYYGLVMSFIGCSLCISLAIIAPSVCYMKMETKDSLTQKIVCTFIIILGVVGATAGTYSNLQEIIEKY